MTQVGRRFFSRCSADYCEPSDLIARIDVKDERKHVCLIALRGLSDILPYTYLLFESTLHGSFDAVFSLSWQKECVDADSMNKSRPKNTRIIHQMRRRATTPSQHCCQVGGLPCRVESVRRRTLIQMTLFVGTAAWTVPKQHLSLFLVPGKSAKPSHLERYASRLRCVEINSSFHRPHRRATWERWAATTPAHFLFAVKAPRP